MTTMPVRWRKAPWLLACGMIFAFAARGDADFKPLTKEEQAKVDQAIDKGVEFLKRSQTKEGNWKWEAFWKGTYLVGQCAMQAYALLEAGVSADDPAIQKAARFIRPIAPMTDGTYELSLAILFFDRLGEPEDKRLIQTLALRLIAGQHRTGGWSYHCPILTEKNEEDLMKCLGELNKRMEKGGKTRDQALTSIEVPLTLQSLSVFQGASNLLWREPSDTPEEVKKWVRSVSLDGRTDNSNTQFAMLGLWVSQRYGISAQPSFAILVERFERFQAYPSGLWAYQIDKEAMSSSRHSMICVGLLGLAIGRGLKVPSPGLPLGSESDVHVLKGLSALHQYIGTPQGNMKKRVKLQDLYFLWSLERVGMLYNLPTIGDKDWYRWGAENLVANQSKRGAWPGPPPPKTLNGMDYGPGLNTAFALLFLKRSHPMKDLTPKLPFTAKDLNEGIARLRPGDKFPVHTITIPSQSQKLEGTTTPPGQNKKPGP